MAVDLAWCCTRKYVALSGCGSDILKIDVNDDRNVGSVKIIKLNEISASSCVGLIPRPRNPTKCPKYS
jgi:hypothetical protein